MTLPRVSSDGHTVESVAWSTGRSRLASGGFEGTIKLWDVTTYDLLVTPEAPSAAVFSLSWSADGSQLATGSEDGLVRIWDGQSYQRTERAKRA